MEKEEEKEEDPPERAAKRQRLELVPRPPPHPPAMKLITCLQVATRMYESGECNAHAFRKWLKWYHTAH